MILEKIYRDINWIPDYKIITTVCDCSQYIELFPYQIFFNNICIVYCSINTQTIIDSDKLNRYCCCTHGNILVDSIVVSNIINLFLLDGHQSVEQYLDSFIVYKNYACII